MRRQTECNLTVRFRWEVGAGQHHPEHTFSCAEDLPMAAQMAMNARLAVPRGIRFVGIDVSPDGGRYTEWEPIDLDKCAELAHPAPALTST